MRREPGFYWIRVLEEGPRAVVAEWVLPGAFYTCGDEEHLYEHNVEVLSERLTPPEAP